MQFELIVLSSAPPGEDPSSATANVVSEYIVAVVTRYGSYSISY